MKILRHPLFMRPDPDGGLEQWLDRELRQLPPRRAPATLAPRVLEAIARRQALPWWRKSFAYWPAPARLAFLAASTALAVVLVSFVMGLTGGASAGALGGEAGEWFAGVRWLRTLGDAMGGAVMALVRAAGPWFLWAILGIAVVSYLTTVALGTVCWRLATQRF